MTRRAPRNTNGEPVRAAIRRILAEHARSWPGGFGRLPKAAAIREQLPDELRRSLSEIRRHVREILETAATPASAQRASPRIFP